MQKSYLFFFFFKIIVLLLLGRSPMLEVETTGGCRYVGGFIYLFRALVNDHALLMQAWKGVCRLGERVVVSGGLWAWWPW